MASGVTYQGDVQRSEAATKGLFAGLKLWFSRSVPSREWFMRNAELNGAQVVQLEQQADIKLVDHARKNQAPGTYSYQYVESSIRKGVLEELDAHKVGSTTRVDRPVGSVVTASKGRRNKFTDADDQILWNWIKPFAEAGGAWQGLEIYKQLEAAHPNHTFQSWRERWIKYTQYQSRNVTEQVQQDQGEVYDQAEQDPRSPKRRKIQVSETHRPQQANIGVVHADRKQDQQAANVEPVASITDTAASAMPQKENAAVVQEHPMETNVQENNKGVRETLTGDKPEASVENGDTGNADQDTKTQSEAEGDDESDSGVTVDAHRLPLAYNFTQEEARKLYRAACYILNTDPEHLDNSWTAVAQDAEHKRHTKEVWRSFFYDFIVPEYRRRNNLNTDEELKIHYIAEVRRRDKERALREKEREQKAKELALSKQLEVHHDEVEGEALTLRGAELEGQGQIDGTDDAPASGPYDSLTSTTPQPPYLVARPSEGSNEPAEQTGSLAADPHNGSKDASQLYMATSTSLDDDTMRQIQPGLNTIDLQPTSVSVNASYHPPRPNESRKLSQSRRSQSVSTQSQSLSLSQSQHNPVSMLQQQNTKSTPVDSSQQRSDLDDNNAQFVTQISHCGPSIPEESDDEDLGDIHYRAPTPPKRNLKSELPLFVPERFQRPVANIQDETILSSSPIRVQLLDDNGENLIEEDQLSEYAPSEAPSEAIQFESQLQLSQVWETTPDQVQHDEPYQDSAESEYHYDEYETAPQQPEALSMPQKQTSDLGVHDNVSDKLSTEADFETAPTDMHDSGPLSTNSTEPPVRKTRKENNRHLNTQALFQQPTQTDFAELIAIPEPPGGWDEEEEVTLTPANFKQIQQQQLEADWTLPLPDPSANDLKARSASQESDGTEVDDWLALQAQNHPSLPPFLLTPLSHRALESTSMDLHLATRVLDTMLHRFKDASVSLNAIRALPKQDRKETISRIVEDLVPADVQGCWTRSDDKALLGVSGREVKRIEDKHGVDSVSNRFEFLEMWNSDA